MYYDHKRELFLKSYRAVFSACCLFYNPRHLFFKLTKRNVFKEVYSVQFKPILEHFVAEFFITLQVVVITMSNHKTNGNRGDIVFVIKFDDLDL